MMISGYKQGRKASLQRITASWLLILLMGLFVYFVPAYAMPRIGVDHYEKWVEQHGEPPIGMIEIWHVAGFKPYSGSLGSWLERTADKYFSDYIGVYYKVRSLTPDEANELYSRGLCPDVISFPHGYLPLTSLTPLSFSPDHAAFQSGVCRQRQYALPYCASGTLLLYTQEAASSDDKDRLISAAGTAEQFKAQKTSSCITDIRGTGDLERAQLLGKCPFFEAAPIKAGESLVQYVGLGSQISPGKIPYCEGLIEFIVSQECEESLPSIGLLPVLPVSDPDFERDYLMELYSLFDSDLIPPCF